MAQPIHRRAKVTDRLPFLGVKWLFWNRNIKTIPSEYKDILNLILKVLNRPLKWDTARLWTPPGLASTSHQSWTLFVLVVKRSFFSNVQLWRLMEPDPVGVQRRTVFHFKGLFKTFKMRYSMSLCSDRIVFKFWFQKSHFTPKNGNRSVTFARLCNYHMEDRAHAIL